MTGMRQIDAGLRAPRHTSFIPDIMFLFQLRQLLLSSSQVCLGGRSVLLSWHMIEDHDITFLKMKTVQVVQCILRL
jgi:hypothetical protein